jgi:hypothetical protein
MTKAEMEKIVKDYAIESYHVTALPDGGFELRYGPNDPAELLRQAEMEIETMKVQIRWLMTMCYNIDYTRAEELII